MANKHIKGFGIPSIGAEHAGDLRSFADSTTENILHLWDLARKLESDLGTMRNKGDVVTILPGREISVDKLGKSLFRISCTLVDTYGEGGGGGGGVYIGPFAVTTTTNGDDEELLDASIRAGWVIRGCELIEVGGTSLNGLVSGVVICAELGGPGNVTYTTEASLGGCAPTDAVYRFPIASVGETPYQYQYGVVHMPERYL